jgi:hypothetical protein
VCVCAPKEPHTLGVEIMSARLVICGNETAMVDYMEGLLLYGFETSILVVAVIL